MTLTKIRKRDGRLADIAPTMLPSGCQGQRNLQGTAAADVIHIGHLCRTIFFWRNVPSAFYMSGARSMTFLPGA